MKGEEIIENNKWCNDLRLRAEDIRTILFCTEILIWTVGVLGNLVNVIVFRHKKMTNPINLIFLWLSISDLLELTILAFYQWLSGWSGNMRTTSAKMSVSNFNTGIYYLTCIYLFQVVHTITVGLNIVLVYCQYKVVSHPLMNRKNPFNYQFMKLAVIWIYILSFILYLPFWYTQEIVEKKLPNNETYWSIGIREYRIKKRRYISKDPLVSICLLICGVVLRIGPLIILITLCALLLFAMKKGHRNRGSLGMEAYQLSKAQREVNRMSITIVVIMIMFLITEIPLGISGFLTLHFKFIGCSYLLDDTILPIFILLNCSYSIFCYLIRIKEYRETLKLFLPVGKINSVNNFRLHIVLFLVGPMILLHFIVKNINYYMW